MTTLAVDWGGRRIKLGIVQDGNVVALSILSAEADQPLRLRLKVVVEHLDALCRRHGIRTDECEGVAFAYPSIIDTVNGRILDHFGKFGEAGELDLRSWAKETIGLPLAIDNDARAALIGEWRHGAGKDCDNLVIMTLGTGLGTSVVMQGRVVRGVHGQAGILGGHFTVQYDGRRCVCGNVGCAEAEASTWMLDSLARARRDFSASNLSSEALIDYAAIFRLASVGDACACALRDHSLRVWSAAAVNLIHAYDPEKIILGGGVMASGGVILAAISDRVRQNAHTPWGRVQVVSSALGDHAALLGGEWLVQEQREFCCEKS
jgi:glucokinase